MRMSNNWHSDYEAQTLHIRNEHCHSGWSKLGMSSNPNADGSLSAHANSVRRLNEHGGFSPKCSRDRLNMLDPRVCKSTYAAFATTLQLPQLAHQVLPLCYRKPTATAALFGLHHSLQPPTYCSKPVGIQTRARGTLFL